MYMVIPNNSRHFLSFRVTIVLKSSYFDKQLSWKQWQHTMAVSPHNNKANQSFGICSTSAPIFPPNAHLRLCRRIQMS